MRLFEKTDKGLLAEVPPEQADERRRGRRVSRVTNAEYDLLWTAEEEAAREAEMAADEAARAAEQLADARATAAREERQAVLAAKLQPLGITLDELREAF